MEINLELLKKNFSTIKDIIIKVTTIFDILDNRINKLKELFFDFIKINKDNLFVFGLDSFHFQTKLIDIEFDDMKRLYYAITNRIYCEYYKLYKIIADYIKENIEDKKIMDIIAVTNHFPIYKDLEPFKQYNFELIQEIHENIILLLYGMNEFISNKEIQLTMYQNKQENGLNINNFVNTFNYNIIVMKEKGLLFISYIQFFHSMHTKYLHRFAMKMNLMYGQIKHDIKFDDNISQETKKREVMDILHKDKIDSEIINQIKQSIEDTDSNDSLDNNKNNNKNNDNSDINLINQQDSIKKKEDGKKKNLKNIFKKNVNKVINGLKFTKISNKNEILNNQLDNNQINNFYNTFQNNNEVLIDCSLNIKIDDNINNISAFVDIEKIYNDIDNSLNQQNDKNLLKEKNMLNFSMKSDTILVESIFNELNEQCSNVILPMSPNKKVTDIYSKTMGGSMKTLIDKNDNNIIDLDIDIDTDTDINIAARSLSVEDDLLGESISDISQTTL